MTVEYETVYQVSNASSDWYLVLAGGVLFVIDVLLILSKLRFGWRQPNWFFLIFACGCGLLWFGPVGFSAQYEDSRALQSGHYRVVEGNVTDFHPMPYDGHEFECFSVQQQRFCYSDYVIVPGFRNTASHGGPIRSGLPVRIAYSGGAILRLEIARNELLSTAESIRRTDSAEQGWETLQDKDPILSRMNVAFLFMAVCCTLWWNLKWKRVIRFWVRPPNRPWVQNAFRAFFALSFISTLWRFVEQIRTHPLSKQEVLPTLKVAGAICAVAALMNIFVLWMTERLDRKAKDSLLSQDKTS